MVGKVDELVGKSAPDFEARVVGGGYPEGATVRLSELRGQTVVLYFYPKDDTPGCTTQACGLRDGWNCVGKKAIIFGVSVDSVESHRRFIEKHKLPFALLSDESKEIVQAYGMWVEKSLYGKKFMGTERSTVIISPDGVVRCVLRKVQPAKHLDLLLKELD